MKPHGNYHPPQGWVKFSTLRDGAKFHNIMNGQPVQFIKVSMAHCDPYNAVDLSQGARIGLLTTTSSSSRWTLGGWRNSGRITNLQPWRRLWRIKALMSILMSGVSSSHG